MIMIIYQLYYMWGEKCKIDETFNDVYLFCWNDGCTPDQVGQNIEKNILYMANKLLLEYNTQNCVFWLKHVGKGDFSLSSSLYLYNSNVFKQFILVNIMICTLPRKHTWSLDRWYHFDHLIQLPSWLSLVC